MISKALSFLKALPYLSTILSIVGGVLAVLVANQRGKSQQKKNDINEIKVYEMSEYIETKHMIEEVEQEIKEEKIKVQEKLEEAKDEEERKQIDDSSKSSRINKLRSLGIVRK